MRRTTIAPSGLVVNGTPLVSACIQGKAFRIILDNEGKIHWITALETVERVQFHLAKVAIKRKANLSSLLASLAILLQKIEIYDEEFYKEKLSDAKQLIGSRYPRDAGILSLAMKANLPLWTDDKDFQIQEVKRRIKVYTTAELLKVV